MWSTFLLTTDVECWQGNFLLLQKSLDIYDSKAVKKISKKYFKKK